MAPPPIGTMPSPSPMDPDDGSPQDAVSLSPEACAELTDEDRDLFELYQQHSGLLLALQGACATHGVVLPDLDLNREGPNGEVRVDLGFATVESVRALAAVLIREAGRG